MQKLFRPDINIVVDKGYKVQTSGNERKLQYFLVEGNYQLWPVLVEGSKKETNRNCEKFNDEHRGGGGG